MKFLMLVTRLNINVYSFIKRDHLIRGKSYNLKIFKGSMSLDNNQLKHFNNLIFSIYNNENIKFRQNYSLT